jgi:hypothetical protein
MPHSSLIGEGWVDIVVRRRAQKGDLTARTLDPRGRWDQEKSKGRLGAGDFALVGGTIPSAVERVGAAVTRIVT